MMRMDAERKGTARDQAHLYTSQTCHCFLSKSPDPTFASESSRDGTCRGPQVVWLDWYQSIGLDIDLEALRLVMSTADLMHGEHTLSDQVDVGPTPTGCFLYKLPGLVSNSLGLGQEAGSQGQQLMN